MPSSTPAVWSWWGATEKRCRWATTLSITQGNEESIRGFLNDGYREATGDNASGVTQSRRLTDVFFDTHLTDRLAPWLWVTYGLNELYGSALQSSQGFTYVAPLDGNAPALSSAGTPAGTASPLLRPETQRSLVVGLKADGLDGRFDVDLRTFLVDFNNQPVTGQIGGNPVLTSGGGNRFKGLELESSFRLTSALTLAAHASYSDARYREFNTLVGGTRLALTSKVLAGAHMTFAPAIGWGASLAMNYAGRRFLDKLNTVEAGGYAVVDAFLAYRFGRYTVSLVGSNLTNRRDPILRGELG